MINYNDEFLRLFYNVKGDFSILNIIESIHIKVRGSFDISVNSPIFAVLERISITENEATFNLRLDIPSIFADTVHISVIGRDGHAAYISDYDNISVDIVYESGYQDGVYVTDAKIRSKCLAIQPIRTLQLFGSDPKPYISICDGSNVSVSMSGDTLNISGFAGAGTGRHDPTADKTQDKFKGIKSINGLRLNRNVDIELSDKLISYGASVS